MSNKLKPRRTRRSGSSGPKFIQLFRYVLDCPAYVSLSLVARAALIELNLGYNGSNNGKIVLSVRQLAERLGCDKGFANRALQELIEKGFIERRVKGAFSVKFRRATEWRLNDRRCDATGQEQSQPFLKWRAPEPQTQAEAPAEFPPWEVLGMSRASWYRRNKPAPLGETETISRYAHDVPYGTSTAYTGNFSETPARDVHSVHSETFHGTPTTYTSTSTRATEPDAAPVAAAPHAVLSNGHDVERLPIDDLSIPTFLRRP
jgi:hypothetical protein